jgi:superfamily II DNA or RNA helicase
MAKLLILGNYCKLIDEQDADLLLSLDKALSFYVIGAEYTAAFKGYMTKDGWKRWNGYKHLLNANLTFATGLLVRVKKFYADAGKELVVVDNRPPKSVGIPKDIIPKLKSIGITPYDYQLDAVKAVDIYDRGIIKIATGGGKSIVSALITAKLGKKTVVYVIGKDLLHQFHGVFSSIFDEKIGIVGDGLCDIQNITIASIWSVGQALGLKKSDIILDDNGDEAAVSKDKYIDILKMVKEAKVWQIDECHMSAAETVQKIYRASNAEHIYGLSGTPWRSDGAEKLIESILGEYIIDIPASQLIASGHLVKPQIQFVPVPYMKCAKNYNTVYKEYVVENQYRNDLVLKYAKILTEKGYKTLVLFSSIKHGKILYDLISPHIKCALLDGSDDKETRDSVKEDIVSGKIDCILASRIFDLGIDLPCLSGLVVASAGKSTVRALQRVGRIIRKFEGKTQAAVVDFADDAVFLKEHAKIRHKVYCSEKGFDVWPENLKTK